VLFCATISNGADKLIRSAQVSNMAEALVLDSLASVAIEQVCDEVEKIIRSAYPNMYSTWRLVLAMATCPSLHKLNFSMS